VHCTLDGIERLESLKTTVIDKKRLLNCISVEVFLMEFVLLWCDISTFLNMLWSNIITIYCLYQQCDMFWSFLWTITRSLITYLKRVCVCMHVCKLNIINLQAHKTENFWASRLAIFNLYTYTCFRYVFI